MTSHSLAVTLVLFSVLRAVVVQEMPPNAAPFKRLHFCNEEVQCGEARNEGCGCEPNKYCNVMLTRLVEFRQMMLNMHNTLRNFMASGKTLFYRGAHKMNALQYNLELEHLCICHFHTRCELEMEHPFACLKTPSFPNNSIGFNLLEMHGRLDNPRIMAKIAYETWYLYNEERVNSHIFESFPPGNVTRGVKHLTQMLWDTATEIGCSRHYNFIDQRQFLCCAYAHEEGTVSHAVGMPTYEYGADVCSKCPASRPCNVTKGSIWGRLEFASLCGGGERFRIPDQITTSNLFVGRMSGAKQDGVLMLLLMVLCFVFY